MPPERQLAGLILSGLLAIGGGGTVGYYARGSSAVAAEAPVAHVDREQLEELRRWRAAQDVRDAQRDRVQADLAAAIRDLTATTASVREVVVASTQRLGDIDTRLQRVERGRR